MILYLDILILLSVLVIFYIKQRKYHVDIEININCLSAFNCHHYNKRRNSTQQVNNFYCQGCSSCFILVLVLAIYFSKTTTFQLSCKKPEKLYELTNIFSFSFLFLQKFGFGHCRHYDLHYFLLFFQTLITLILNDLLNIYKSL